MHWIQRRSDSLMGKYWILKDLKRNSFNWRSHNWKPSQSTNMSVTWGDKKLLESAENCSYDWLWQLHFWLLYFFGTSESCHNIIHYVDLPHVTQSHCHYLQYNYLPVWDYIFQLATFANLFSLWIPIS